MDKSLQLEKKIRPKIQEWLEKRDAEFALCIKEFCQGNRASLNQVRIYLKELGIKVFAGDGKELNTELLENLEYGIFDLIGKFASTPYGPALLIAIQENLLDHLTEIFANTKRRWNFKNYKITESYEELDPNNCLIPASGGDPYFNDEVIDSDVPVSSKNQARLVLDELVLYAKDRFRGEKIRKIAINWLENPERDKDFGWFASLVNTSPNSVKVNLTRIKKALTQRYIVKKVDNKLILVRSRSTGRPKRRRADGYRAAVSGIGN